MAQQGQNKSALKSNAIWVISEHADMGKSCPGVIVGTNELLSSSAVRVCIFEAVNLCWWTWGCCPLGSQLTPSTLIISSVMVQSVFAVFVDVSVVVYFHMC